jgi:hypothetical protein
LAADGVTWNLIADAESVSNVANAGFREDFLSAPPDTEISSTSDQVAINGDTPWYALKIKGGSEGGVESTGGSFANPGVITLSSLDESTGDGVLLSKNPPLGALAEYAGWQADMILSVSNGTSEIAVTAGFGETVNSDPPAYAIYVRYDTAAGDSQFTWVTNNGSGNTTTSTANSVAPTGNFYHFRIRSLVAGTVLFSVNGGAEAAISTNLPLSEYGAIPLYPFVQLITRGASSPQVSIDFFSYTAQTGRT